LITSIATSTAKTKGYEVVETNVRKASLNENELDDIANANKLERGSIAIAQGLLTLTITSRPRFSPSSDYDEIRTRMSAKLIDLTSGKEIWSLTLNFFGLHGNSDGLNYDLDDAIEVLSRTICNEIPVTS
jgi:hypothetical protein